MIFFKSKDFSLCKKHRFESFLSPKTTYFYILQNRSGILTNQNQFFTNQNKSDYFQKKRLHSKINLCDLIFVSHVQHIIHDMHKKVHWSQESRRPDSLWAEWVPNTFLFLNLASYLVLLDK